MKSISILLGSVAANAGVANFFDFSSGGTCGFGPNPTELRVSAPSALYNEKNGCGTCVKFTLGDKVAIARITDLCKTCKENQFNAGESVYTQLGEEEDMEEISFDWETTACPSTIPTITWQADSTVHWARFLVSEFPDNIKDVFFFNSDSKWIPLKKSEWSEYDAPKVTGRIPSSFKIKILGRSGQTQEYAVNFPSSFNFSKLGENYYTGPVFLLSDGRMIRDSINPTNKPTTQAPTLPQTQRTSQPEQLPHQHASQPTRQSESQPTTPPKGQVSNQRETKEINQPNSKSTQNDTNSKPEAETTSSSNQGMNINTLIPASVALLISAISIN